MSQAPEEPPVSAPSGRGFDALVRPAAFLIVVGFAIWLLFTFRRYGERYAQASASFYVGGTHMVEIKLTPDTREGHACASGADLGGLSCAYGSDQKPVEPARDDLSTLRPYQTVRGETVLGAGLWSAPDLRAGGPDKRATVVCNFHVRGVVRSFAMRWKPGSRFFESKSTIAAGALTDCAFPQ